MKKLLLGLTAALFLVACGEAKEEPKTETKAAEKPAKVEKLIVGATPVPHQELLELVKEDLKAQGVELEIVTFNDYIQPNKLLGTKELDANFFQHVPYMEDFGKKNNLDLVSVGSVHVEPMAVYSKKIKNINDLKAGDSILIPNDPTNGGRALILLDKAGVIKLKDNKKLDSTIADIAENPKNLKFNALAPEQLAPRLEEVTAAIINANFALNAKLSFKDDTILVEDKDSPYVNIVTVLKGRENEEKIQKLIKALQSEKVKKYIDEKYNGSVIAAF